MSCENYKILIHDLVEGELDSHVANDVNLHIFACQSCQAEFEMLNNEREMYSHFLFEIEPPKDLSANFQSRLEAENSEKIVSTPSAFSFNNWFANLFLKPILVGAIALIIFGFGYIWLNNPNQNKETVFVLQPLNSNTLPSANLEKKEFVEKNTATEPVEITKFKPIPLKKVEQISFKKNKSVEAKPNIIKANLPINKKPIILHTKPQNFVQPPKISNEDEVKFKQFQVFETETAKHLERTEMLLRSFRNVRYAEGGEEYDVGFEKQQARKLLEKNVQLRQQAENYGAMPENEMLSKVEPYLLEIANLDVNPTEEEVLEIKQRVKNQNLIVSLQSF